MPTEPGWYGTIPLHQSEPVIEVWVEPQPVAICTKCLGVTPLEDYLWLDHVCWGCWELESRPIEVSE